MKSNFLLFVAVLATTTASALQPTAEEQAALSPDAVLADLMAGNARFVAEETRRFDIEDRIERGVEGQYPKAYILSCVDSRVPVEAVFDQHIGDIFVGRVAGNVDTTEQLGSMEFACRVAGAKLVLVLGHQACGAVMGACDGVELGNLTALLAEIAPAVEVAGGFGEDERDSANAAFVEAVVEQNVRLTVADIRQRSTLLAEMETAGEIRIVGGLYSLETGAVTLLD